MKFLAYIDPGQGSFAVQAIIGGLLGAGYLVRARILSIIRAFKKEPDSDKSSSE